MPFTPVHFGASACLALLLCQYLDFPVFILANIFVDIEPLMIGLFWPTWYAHGYFHTLIFGIIVGFVIAVICHLGKSVLEKVMQLTGLSYETNFRKMLISAIAGVWFHIFLDALVSADVYLFFPLKVNPFFGIMPRWLVELLCLSLFIPAVTLYLSKEKLKKECEMKKILIIDDEKDFCFFIKENLEATGKFKVFVLNNPKEGLETALKNKPDLILLDILMPQMNGFAALDIFKHHEETQGIPVVMLTAKEDDESKMKASSLYDEDYIIKPVAVDVLVAKLEKIFTRMGKKI